MVSAVVASNNSAMSHKLQYNKQLLHRVINKHHQPNARAVCCTVLSLLNVSLWNGTATMIFKQWLSAGIKRACSQSEYELLVHTLAARFWQFYEENSMSAAGSLPEPPC